MVNVTLGKTGITVNKNGFGALPIQRISQAEAVRLLNKARSGGMTFFDTARCYSDSEEKLGAAFGGAWDGIFVASKTMAETGAGLNQDLETSLKALRTDHIDLYQLHNTPFCPKPGDSSGLYDALLEAKQAGKIRHIGITNHRLPIAWEAIESGLYDTLQFPFCYLSAEKEQDLMLACKKANMGFIAMKALSGGLIRNSAAAYAWLAQYENVLPIWGIQLDRELDEFLSYINNPPALTAELQFVINRDQQELCGNFCRGCGYCMPCPADIQISDCARMSLLLRRSPSEQWFSPAWQANMQAVDNCLHCGQCSSRCPYGLDTPALLVKNLMEYRQELSKR